MESSTGTEPGGEPQVAPGQDDGAEIRWMQKMRESTIFSSIENIINEIYPYVASSDFLLHSFSYAKRNLAESPCSALLYAFLILFGFLPIICFFLFVCGTLILWLVCFIFCQAIALTLAGAVCGGMFFFIVIAGCVTASAFGMTVHTLSFLGQVYRVLAFNAPDAIAFLRQQLRKFGVHLRLPEDDQT